MSDALKALNNQLASLKQHAEMLALRIENVQLRIQLEEEAALQQNKTTPPVVPEPVAPSDIQEERIISPSPENFLTIKEWNNELKAWFKKDNTLNKLRIGYEDMKFHKKEFLNLRVDIDIRHKLVFYFPVNVNTKELDLLEKIEHVTKIRGLLSTRPQPRILYVYY